MSIAIEAFGVTAGGEPVRRVTLTNKNGLSVSLISYGATVQALLAPDRDGRPRDLVLGYPTLAGYEQGEVFLGATVGRYANRIGGGTFSLNGRRYQLTQNEGKNTLHGGRGLHKRVFALETRGEDTAVFSLLSRDGEDGFPGEVRLEIVYTLGEDNSLTFRQEAVSTEDTVLTLCNHSYFNLEGEGDVLGHELRLFSSHILEIDGGLIPTGRLLPVEGTPFDFRQSTPIGARIQDPDPQLRLGAGYDHCYVLEGPRVAEVTAPGSGISLSMETSLPGVQLYSGNYLAGEPGKGRRYGPRSGFCLETQFFPDAPNRPEFPSPVLRRGETYRHWTRVHFASPGLPGEEG